MKARLKSLTIAVATAALFAAGSASAERPASLANTTWTMQTNRDAVQLVIETQGGPGAPGAAQNFVVRNLARQVTYYFAARVSDDAGNPSGLSNVPSATTPDSMAPAAITNLSASLVLITSHSGHAVRPRNLESQIR